MTVWSHRVITHYARTFCDKASSSMHLGEVPSNELTHLDEEVAYISHTNWRWFTLALQKGAIATKAEAMQLFSFTFFLGSWQVGGKVGGTWCEGCRCDICVAITPLSRQPQSSSVHVIVVSLFFIKMCLFITWYVYFSWMHGWFCFVEDRNSLHYRSWKRFTFKNILNWMLEGWKWKGRSPIMTHSPTLSSCPLPSWPRTCNIISTEHGIHYFFQFSSENQKLSFIPIRKTVVTKAACLFATLYNKNMTPSEIWIMALVTASPYADPIATGRLPFIVGPWISLTVQPLLRSINPQFPSSFHDPPLP